MSTEQSEELKKIDDILDQYIREGLKADGGNMEVVDYDAEKKLLRIKYQGACGCCPMATMGTLMAIQRTLRQHFDPAIEVKPVQ